MANSTGALENLKAKAQVLLRPHIICYEVQVENPEYFEVFLIELHLQMSHEQAHVRYQKAISYRKSKKSSKIIHSLVKASIDDLGFCPWKIIRRSLCQSMKLH